MRLRQIEQLIDAAQIPQRVQYEGTQKLPGGEIGSRLHNLNAWRRALSFLRQINALGPYTAPLLENTVITESVSDTVSGSVVELNQTAIQLQHMQQAASELLRVIKGALPRQDEKTLVIEIPQPESLHALNDRIRELDRFFNLIAKAEDGAEPRVGQPAVQAFDSGSFYIEVTVAAYVGVTVVGAIGRAALTFLREYQQLRVIQESAHAYSEVAADMASMRKQNEVMRLALARKAADILQKEHFQKADKEALAAINALVVEGANLLRDGVKILPPATAPEKVRSVFPNPEELKFLSSPEVQKLLSSDTEAK